MKTPDPYHWTLNSYSSAFCNVLVHLGPFRYYKKQRSNRTELVQLMQKFEQRIRFGIFRYKGPDPYHCILNSCSGAFHNVWGLLGTFRYCMRLCANRAELVQLMQKVVQRSGVEIFRNECTRSIPLDPNLMFWYVS